MDEKMKQFYEIVGQNKGLEDKLKELGMPSATGEVSDEDLSSVSGGGTAAWHTLKGCPSNLTIVDMVHGFCPQDCPNLQKWSNNGNFVGFGCKILDAVQNV